jgi:RNAse (barnase) inhibitor barstar
VSWALVQAASVDASVADVWMDVMDDFTMFVRPLPQWDKPVLVLDGARIDSLDDVWDQVSGWLLPDASHGRGMDAFNDILRGGFGTPDEGFTIQWTDARRSAEVLGAAGTARYYERMLERCHPDNRASVSQLLDEARRGAGQTLFDMLVEIIKVHGPGGSEYGDLVDLELIP